MKHVLEPERCPGSRSEAHIGCQRCTGCDEHVCCMFVETFGRTLCARKASPAPADAAEPDPDEVRRALDTPVWRTEIAGDLTLRAAATAWLKLREQPAEPAPTIAQVIEACGEFNELYVVNGGPGCGWAASTAKNGQTVLKVPRADTAEAAFAKLYPTAVQKLRDTRDAADQKLQQLGVA